MVLSVGVFAQTTGPIHKDKPNNGQIAIELTVHPYAEVYVPTKELKFSVQGSGSTANNSIEVKVKSNSQIKVQVVSKGFVINNDEQFEELNDMVIYTLGDPKGPGYSRLFKPNTTWTDIFQEAGVDTTYVMNFDLQYRPGTDFHKVLADTYYDTIEWTVEAVN